MMATTKRIIIFTTMAAQIIVVFSIPPTNLVPPRHHQQTPITRIRPPPPHQPGFMQRIARWFGFGNGPKDQQLEATYQNSQYKGIPQGYQYLRPKANCNLCNKVPWIPMFPGDLQYPLIKSHSNQPSNPQIQFQHNGDTSLHSHVSLPTYAPPHSLPPQPPAPPFQYAPAFNFQPPLVQRAVKFNFPSFNNFGHFKQDFIPPGNGLQSNNLQQPQFRGPLPIPNLSATPIPPLYNAVPFSNVPQSPGLSYLPQEIVSASEPHTITPPPPPPPIIGSRPQQEDPSVEIVQSVPVTDFVSSVEYPLNVIQSQVIDIATQEKSVDSDVPKLVELGSYESSYRTVPPKFSSEPFIASNRAPELDNFPEASSHTKLESFEKATNFINSTPEPFRPTEIPSSTTTPAPTSFENILIINDEVEPIGGIEFHPSLQTVSQTPEVSKKQERQTPKRLLDSPILYLQGSSPRPFTRDPSDLRVRSSTYKHTIWQPGPTPTPWVFAPTPTSTYSSIDASGQFAGIHPPAQFQPAPVPFPKVSEKTSKQIHQIIIPYTSKNKPRPFRTREELSDQPNEDSRYVNWSHLQELDAHEQQESKLVTATEAPLKTTKYLTKILASNIRELLKKEYDDNNKSKQHFDFSKLQKNIDEWTQQEFTSLTHKASTVSLNGRSKNIPSEYLTTTQSLKQTSPTEATTDAPHTSTNLPKSLIDEEQVKKYEFLSKLIEDNEISNSENYSDTTEVSLTSTTTTEKAVSPFYIRTVPPTPSAEPWQQLKVSISPLTKEKVYVVTPQPSFQHKVTIEDAGSFKSPRFLVRPTPGNGSVRSSNITLESVRSSYTPELFGLMGISAYIPAAPVETLDGHSKVITVITPASSKNRSSEEIATSLPVSQLASPSQSSTSQIAR